MTEAHSGAGLGGIDPHRIAEIIVRVPGDGPGRRGSGYRVASDLVLTAAHVVAGAASVTVRFDADRPDEVTVQVLETWTSSGTDLCVLRIPPVSASPTGYGRLDRDRRAVVPVHAAGFPVWKVRTDFRELAHVRGTVALLANRRTGTLEVAIADPPPADDASPWAAMSGAPVWVGDRIVGVVVAHHQREGLLRLTAETLDDALSAAPSLGPLLGIASLFDVTPVPRHERVRSVYLEQVRGIAPRELRDREAELDELVAFCSGTSPYVWWQAPPWSGKTALTSTLVLHPPAGVDVVSFFVIGRLTTQSDSEAFVGALTDQLYALLGEEPLTALAPSARHADLARLLRAASARAVADGRRLLMVVDGLDEDSGAAPGSLRASIASLLPADPGPGLRIVLSGRPHPPIPGDVPDDHPIRHCRIRELPSSDHARELADRAVRELQHVLRHGDHLDREILGFVAASGGGLTQADLEALTTQPPYAVLSHLNSSFGRVIRAQAGGYLFAHEELRVKVEEQLGAVLLDTFRSRVHTWANGYAAAGWPPDTPGYLLQGYPAVLPPDRLVALATDPARHQRLLDATGGDAAALGEVRTALAHAANAADPDLLACATLALHRDRLAERNANVPTDLPAVWVRIGSPERATALAGSIIDPLRRAQALTAAVETAAELGFDDQAMAIAAAIPQPDLRGLALLTAVELLPSPDRALRVARSIESPRRRAQALVLLLEAGVPSPVDEAVDAAAAVPDPEQRGEVLLSIVAAVAASDLERAATIAASLPRPSWHGRAVTAVAEAALAWGDVARAAVLAGEVQDPGQADLLRARVAWSASDDVSRALADVATTPDLAAWMRSLAVDRALSTRDIAAAVRMADAIGAPAPRRRAVGRVVAALLRDGRLADAACALAGRPAEDHVEAVTRALVVGRLRWALAAAGAIDEVGPRSIALEQVAVGALDAGDPELAFVACGLMPERRNRAVLGCRLAGRLYGDQLPTRLARLTRHARAWVAGLPDESERGELLEWLDAQERTAVGRASRPSVGDAEGAEPSDPYMLSNRLIVFAGGVMLDRARPSRRLPPSAPSSARVERPPPEAKKPVDDATIHTVAEMARQGRLHSALTEAAGSARPPVEKLESTLSGAISLLVGSGHLRAAADLTIFPAESALRRRVAAVLTEAAIRSGRITGLMTATAALTGPNAEDVHATLAATLDEWGFAAPALVAANAVADVPRRLDLLGSLARSAHDSGRDADAKRYVAEIGIAGGQELNWAAVSRAAQAAGAVSRVTEASLLVAVAEGRYVEALSLLGQLPTLAAPHRLVAEAAERRGDCEWAAAIYRAMRVPLDRVDALTAYALRLAAAGQVRLSLSVAAATGRPHVRVATLDAILRHAEPTTPWPPDDLAAFSAAAVAVATELSALADDDPERFRRPVGLHTIAATLRDHGRYHDALVVATAFASGGREAAAAFVAAMIPEAAGSLEAGAATEFLARLWSPGLRGAFLAHLAYRRCVAGDRVGAAALADRIDDPHCFVLVAERLAWAALAAHDHTGAIEIARDAPDDGRLLRDVLEASPVADPATAIALVADPGQRARLLAAFADRSARAGDPAAAAALAHAAASAARDTPVHRWRERGLAATVYGQLARRRPEPALDACRRLAEDARRPVLPAVVTALGLPVEGASALIAELISARDHEAAVAEVCRLMARGRRGKTALELASTIGAEETLDEVSSDAIRTMAERGDAEAASTALLLDRDLLVRAANALPALIAAVPHREVTDLLPEIRQSIRLVPDGSALHCSVAIANLMVAATAAVHRALGDGAVDGAAAIAASIPEVRADGPLLVTLADAAGMRGDRETLTQILRHGPASPHAREVEAAFDAMTRAGHFDTATALATEVLEPRWHEPVLAFVADRAAAAGDMAAARSAAAAITGHRAKGWALLGLLARLPDGGDRPSADRLAAAVRSRLRPGPDEPVPTVVDSWPLPTVADSWPLPTLFPGQRPLSGAVPKLLSFPTVVAPAVLDVLAGDTARAVERALAFGRSLRRDQILFSVVEALVEIGAVDDAWAVTKEILVPAIFTDATTKIERALIASAATDDAAMEIVIRSPAPRGAPAERAATLADTAAAAGHTRTAARLVDDIADDMGRRLGARRVFATLLHTGQNRAALEFALAPRGGMDLLATVVRYTDVPWTVATIRSADERARQSATHPDREEIFARLSALALVAGEPALALALAGRVDDSPTRAAAMAAVVGTLAEKGLRRAAHRAAVTIDRPGQRSDALLAVFDAAVAADDLDLMFEEAAHLVHDPAAIVHIGRAFGTALREPPGRRTLAARLAGDDWTVPAALLAVADEPAFEGFAALLAALAV